jgi:hypothetical protein
MTLNGRKTLRSRKIFTIFSLSLVILIEIIEIITTVKSIMFQPFLKYELVPLNRNPYAIILRVASNMKNDVKTISAMLRKATNPLFGSLRGLSKAKRTLESAIRVRVIISNVWLVATLAKYILKIFVYRKINIDEPSSVF